MPSRQRTQNYIIMISSEVMKDAGITVESLSGQTVARFGGQYWQCVHKVVYRLSDETKGRIIGKALQSGRFDKTTKPERSTPWHMVVLGEEFDVWRMDGKELLNRLSTAVVLATIWDILNAQK